MQGFFYADFVMMTCNYLEFFYLSKNLSKVFK